MLRRTSQRMAAVVPNVYHVLTYNYVPDVMEKRGPHRAAHLEHATAFVKSGKLRMGGAFDPATEGALIVFKADRAEVIDFAENDPYVKNGVVTGYKVLPWNVVVEQ